MQVKIIDKQNAHTNDFLIKYSSQTWYRIYMYIKMVNIDYKHLYPVY